MNLDSDAEDSKDTVLSINYSPADQQAIDRLNDISASVSNSLQGILFIPLLKKNCKLIFNILKVKEVKI